MNERRVREADDRAQVAREAPFVLTFDGRPLPAYPGETVGAALTAAGITTFRITRRAGKPRGLFCGIGLCFDCLVVIDGIPNQRACLTPARPSMDVRPQLGTAADSFGR